MTRVKRSDLRKGKAQRPINYPPPVPLPYDFEEEKGRVENLCKRLADNEVEVRDQCLQDLNRYLSELPTDIDDAERQLLFAKLWKGIFYCFWHSDKPLVQLDCADRIVALADSAAAGAVRRAWLRAAWQCLHREWNIIDRWRMDKYMALVRRLVRYSLAKIAHSGNVEHAQRFVEIIQEEVLQGTSVGLTMHLSDVCLTEFAKSACGPDVFVALAAGIPFYAMSRGNFIQNRVMRNFVEPIAAGTMGDNDTCGAIATGCAKICRQMSVARTTSADARPSFVTAQNLLTEYAERCDAPEEFEPMTLGDKTRRVAAKIVEREVLEKLPRGATRKVMPKGSVEVKKKEKRVVVRKKPKHETRRSRRKKL